MIHDLMICSSHIEFHVEAGLTATLIEAPKQLQGLSIPADHLAACKIDGTPTVGNAAGNSKNFLDLAGQPTAAPRYDIGYDSMLGRSLEMDGS
jgi:iron transport multicopper oxidase